MFAFLKQIMAERRAFVEFEPVSPESANSMNISKKFLHILELSFEAKSLIYDTKLSKPGMQSKKKKKLGTIEERVDVLYHNVIDVLTDTNFDDIIALATAYHNIGLGNAALTNRDNLEGAVRSFSRTLLLLEGKMLNRKAILISISALNELNLACGKLEQQDTPKLLDIALDLYVKYVTRSNSNWYPDPINLASVIGIKEEESNPRIMLHNLHYTTLQDHALDYLANPKNKHAFVKYLHTTLNIRLTDMTSNGTQFDEKYVNWALMLFELSRYFLANGRFSEAKNHIALADYVIYKFFEDRLSKIEERERERFHDLHESYDYVCAMSNKFWGSYGVSLLRYWMKKFSHNKENKSDEIEDVLSLLNIESEKPDLIFSDLEQVLECITIQITETCILNHTDAKSVFIKTLRCLDSAKEYFVADTDIETHTKIILKISETYKYLAGFEEQYDKKIKLHKRRVECLEDVRRKFNETVDTKTELQIYKQVWYEIVASCSTIVNLMLEEAYYDETFKEVSTKSDRYMKLIAENINLYFSVV